MSMALLMALAQEGFEQCKSTYARRGDRWSYLRHGKNQRCMGSLVSHRLGAGTAPLLRRAIFIFSILTDDASQNGSLRMRLLESARFHLASSIFSIFVYVACHVKQTRWQEAARAWEMTELPPSIFFPPLPQWSMCCNEIIRSTLFEWMTEFDNNDNYQIIA
jgi:hypothetical protein